MKKVTIVEQPASDKEEVTSRVIDIDISLKSSNSTQRANENAPKERNSERSNEVKTLSPKTKTQN